MKLFFAADFTNSHRFSSINLRHLWLLVLCFFVASSFAQSPKLKSEVNYNLEAVFIGSQKNHAAKDKAAITFDIKHKTAKCFTKCNFINLKYSTKKNKFKYTSVIPGSVPCPDHLIGLESDLKENFAKVTCYQVVNNKIYFFNKKDTLLIFYE
ncbi:MAG: META domain-containing protein [Bacteroidia bacterium]